MSNEISDAAVLATLRRQMTIAAAKQSVTAGNLANVDTPGYRARELKFSDELDRKLGSGVTLAVTNGRHLAASPVADGDVQEVSGLPARRDGNTVQLDRELLTMTQAAGDFARAQTALAAKFRLVKYAINESR